MSQPLPIGTFKWLKKAEIESIDIQEFPSLTSFAFFKDF